MLVFPYCVSFVAEILVLRHDNHYYTNIGLCPLDYWENESGPNDDCGQNAKSYTVPFGDSCQEKKIPNFVILYKTL
jgi:hypothetical protein